MACGLESHDVATDAHKANQTGTPYASYHAHNTSQGCRDEPATCCLEQNWVVSSAERITHAHLDDIPLALGAGLSDYETGGRD